MQKSVLDFSLLNQNVNVRENKDAYQRRSRAAIHIELTRITFWVGVCSATMTTTATATKTTAALGALLS